MLKRTRKTPQELFLEVLQEDIKENPEKPKETRQGLLKEYEDLLSKTSKKRAYKVTFKNVKDLFYISFQTGNYKQCKYKAIWEAVKYFQDNFHPVFLSENMLYQSRVHRVEELDEFANEGKVPVATLMERLQVSFPCKACGQGKFNYEDYEFRRCYVTEEFDMYPFTKGLLLCKKCFDKYIA